MPANILIVDDSAVQVRVLTEILNQDNHSIFTSFDGSGVLELMIDNRIDVVLLDVVLPGMDGFELLQMIQGCEQTKMVPVIMVTSMTNPLSVKKALEMGAMDYIKKPVEPIEVIARVHSALRLKHQQDMLQEYANQDGLTKIWNKAYVNEALKTMMNKGLELKTGVAFGMFDCDLFKRVNDSYGHVAGDAVLFAVAGIIKKSVKRSDIVGRYGGEEFCVILPNATLEASFIVCERIRYGVEKMAVPFNGEEIKITISGGIAAADAEPGKNYIELIEEADMALYKAKQAGRNRIEFLRKEK